MKDKKLSKEEWRERLSPETFNICWEKGTEPAFSGKFNTEKKAGIYICVCCEEPLFDSKKKYDSGSGWPSFFDVISDCAVNKHSDKSYGMERVEIVCASCGSHLGHLFTDGPDPTGLRYCINSLSLSLVHKEI
jgi:peptide-methionine (R)-S-oxide reductase